MQKELQTLKEKLKDIQTQVGAALTIIESSLDVEGDEDSIVDASDGNLVSQISKAAAFDVVDSGTEPIYKYLQNFGGCATLKEIWEEFFADYAWDLNLLESSIRADSRFGIRLDGRETVVFLNNVRSTEAKALKKLDADMIFDYLVGKTEGATIKQIQSRSKGYSNNSSMDIFNMVVSYDGFMVEDNVHLSKVKVSVC